MKFSRAGFHGPINKMAEKALACKSNHEKSLLLNDFNFKKTPCSQNCQRGPSRSPYSFKYFIFVKFWISVRTMFNNSINNWPIFGNTFLRRCLFGLF